MNSTQNTRTRLTLLSTLAALALGASALAQAPDDILAASGSVRTSISFSDTYAEVLLTIPGERPGPGEPRDPASREVIQKPQKIAAKIVANINGFDFSEIDDAMPLTVSIGGFTSGDLTLAASDEAIRNDGTFPSRSKKATFSYIGSFEKPNGDIVEKRVGALVFAWAEKKLTITLTCSDISSAGVPEIGASDYVGLYADESENGNRPSGKVRFSEIEVPVEVAFGSAIGSRSAIGSGVSATARKRFGNEDAGTLEEFDLNSVSFKGKQD